MLRINSFNGGPNVTLVLEGKLLEPWVEELERVCLDASRKSPNLVLDLQRINFVDEAGVQLLRRLVDRGVELARSSGFVSELLLPAGRGREARDSDEYALIAGLRQNDERSCEQFVRMYHQRMMTVARRLLPDPNDQADAVQDAMISAIDSIDRFEGSSGLGTWVHRITVNACLMKLRGLKRRRTASLEELMPQFDETGHHTAPIGRWRDESPDPLVSAETRRQVRECIDQLPEPYRAVLMLRDIEELSTAETARLLNCTTANVKTRLHRARLALRQLLAPMMEDHATN